MQTHPRLRPYMRFLFVRPEFCPLGDLSTPNIRLSSDSTSRWTPLPLAKSSRYRATSGLSPYRTCAHRAHIKGCGQIPGLESVRISLFSKEAAQQSAFTPGEQAQQLPGRRCPSPLPWVSDVRSIPLTQLLPVYSEAFVHCQRRDFLQ